MAIKHLFCVALLTISTRAEAETTEANQNESTVRNWGHIQSTNHGRVPRYEIMSMNNRINDNKVSQTVFREKLRTISQKLSAFESLNSQLIKQELNNRLLNQKLTDQEKKFSAMQLENVKLTAKLDLLSTQLSYQIEKESRANAVAADLKTDVVTLEDNFKKMKAQINGISTELEDKTTAIEENMASFEVFQKTKNAKIDNSLTEIKGLTKKPAVRFNAREEAGTDYSSDTIMKFNVVTINEGKGFSTVTGVFTAPIGGTYMFLTNLLREQTTHYGIYHNNERVSWVYSQLSGTYQTFGAQVMLVLEPGDQVYVKINSGRIDGGHYGNKVNTFQGYLMN